VSVRNDKQKKDSQGENGKKLRKVHSIGFGLRPFKKKLKAVIFYHFSDSDPLLSFVCACDNTSTQ